MKRSARAEERMVWLLRRMVDRRRGMEGAGFILAWDAEDVDAFVKAFPEAEKTLIVYLMGPNSSPMLNRAAKRAKDRGFIRPGHVGNQDARQFNQRTWCRTWRMTAEGRAFVDALPKGAP